VRIHPSCFRKLNLQKVESADSCTLKGCAQFQSSTALLQVYLFIAPTFVLKRAKMAWPVDSRLVILEMEGLNDQDWLNFPETVGTLLPLLDELKAQTDTPGSLQQ